MLDLKKLKTQGTPILHAYTAKGDGTDTHGVIFDLKLRIPVPDQGAADVIDDYLPGAAVGFRAMEGGDETPREYKGKSDGQSLRIGVFDAATGNPGSPDHEGTGEIREAKMITGRSGAAYHLVVRLFGFPPAAAGYFLDRSRKTEALGITIEPVQGGLNFGGTTAPTLEIATLQTTPGDSSALHFGEVLEEGDRVSVDDFGVSIQVSNQGLIASRIQVSTENGDVRDLVSRYANQCADASLTPSWEFILQALAQIHGMMPPGGRYVLDAAVIAAAFTATLEAIGGSAGGEPSASAEQPSSSPEAEVPTEQSPDAEDAAAGTSAAPADEPEPAEVLEAAPEPSSSPEASTAPEESPAAQPAPQRAVSGGLTADRIKDALRRSAGNVSAAAIILDVDRSKLRRALKRESIIPADFK